MPYEYDWLNEPNAQEIELPNVDGWGDTVIQYCYVIQENGERILLWRVKDIAHTFMEYEREFKKYKIPGKYFRENLFAFRTQLLEWAREIKNGHGEKWMNEYIQMFKHHVK